MKTLKKAAMGVGIPPALVEWYTVRGKMYGESRSLTMAGAVNAWLRHCAKEGPGPVPELAELPRGYKLIWLYLEKADREKIEEIARIGETSVAAVMRIALGWYWAKNR